MEPQTETVIIKQQWWTSEAIRDVDTNVFIVTAGLGSGKTHGICQWHYDRVCLNKRSKFSLFMMPTYQLVHTAAIPTYEKVLENYGLEVDIDYVIVRSPIPLIRFVETGQEVHFLSGNRPEKLKAVEFSHAAIDEAGVTDEEAYKRALERIRCSRAAVRQSFIGGTPEGINWYSERFDSDTNELWCRDRERDHYRIAKDPVTSHQTKYRRFRVTTYDNPYLPPDYVTQIYELHGSNQNYIDSYIFGLFRALVEGNCYKEFKRSIHLMERIEPDPYYDINLTFDFNANPMSWIALQKRRFREYGEDTTKQIAVHEAEMDCSTIDDAVIEFCAKFPVSRFGNTLLSIYGDSSGYAESHKTRQTDYDAIYSILKEIGYKRIELCAMRYNPKETVTVDAVNRMFMNNELLVCEHLQNLQKSLLSTKWKEGTRKIDKPSGETWTHHGDALKYFCFAYNEGQPKRIIGKTI